MYVCIYCGRKKTNRLPVHPYRPVSWLPTHQGFVCIHTYINSMRGKKDATFRFTLQGFNERIFM